MILINYLGNAGSAQDISNDGQSPQKANNHREEVATFFKRME
jgi:hypothetical protein